MIIPLDFVNTIFVIIVVIMGICRMTVESGLGVGNVNPPITHVVSVATFQSTKLAPVGLMAKTDLSSLAGQKMCSWKIGGMVKHTRITQTVHPGYATMTSICHTNSVLVCCNILYIAVFVLSV